jgi:hypothetical protein
MHTISPPVVVVVQLSPNIFMVHALSDTYLSLSDLSEASHCSQKRVNGTLASPLVSHLCVDGTLGT